MNKFGMVLGAAAIATLAGCKDPDYKYDNDQSAQNEVKVVEGEQSAPEIKPIEVKPIETAAQPVEKPVVITADLSKPVVESKLAEPETTVYVVRSGDSLSKISKRYNVTIASIRRLNPTLKGDTIRIGQKLNLPGKVDVGASVAAPVVSTAKKTMPYSGETKTYVVKSGDTLGAIAIASGISVRQLKELNALKKDTIRVGQKLKVPAAKVVSKPTAKKAVEKKAVKPVKKAAEKKPEAPVADTKAPAAAKEAADSAAPAPAEAAPTADASAEQPVAPAADASAAPAASTASGSTATYVVQEGDDMTGVSIRWGVSAAAIRELNNLGETDQLKPGQVIKLPADAQQ